MFFARLTNLKGAGDLPAISQDLIEGNNGTRIVICGAEGPETESVQRALMPLEREGAVIFAGLVSESTKAWLFMHAHVLIAPSYEEGWGVTVADGVASGCWVVCYDLPAIRETSPRGPIFIPVGDVAVFTEAAAECLRKPRPSKVPNQVGGLWTHIAWNDLEVVVSDRTRT